MGLFDVFKKTEKNITSNSSPKCDFVPMVSQKTIDDFCNEIDYLWQDRAKLEETYNNWSKSFFGGVGMRFESLKKSIDFRYVLSMSYDSAREIIFGIGGNGHFWEKFGEGQQIERIHYRISYIFYSKFYNVGSEELDELFERLSQMDYEDAVKWSRMPVSGYALEAQRQIAKMTKSLYQEAGLSFGGIPYTEASLQSKNEKETFAYSDSNDTKALERDSFDNYCIEAVKSLISNNVPFDGHYEADDPAIKGGYYLLEQKPTETEENEVKEVVYHCHHTLSSEGRLVKYGFESFTNKKTFDITFPYRPEVKIVSADQFGGQSRVRELLEQRMTIAGIVKPSVKQISEDKESEIVQNRTKESDNKRALQADTYNNLDDANEDTKAKQGSCETLNVPGINRITENKNKIEASEQAPKNEMSEEVIKIKEKAEADDPDAQYQLAFHYNIGKGVKQDKVEAFRWYSKAAEKGNSDALCMVASAYMRGEMGCKKDLQKAFDFFERAELSGSKSGTRGLGQLGLELGNVYYLGEGVEQDFVKAFQWYEYGAEKGNAEAQCSIAIMYENGQGVERDMKKAIEWYFTASKNGDKEAKYRLAELRKRD